MEILKPGDRADLVMASGGLRRQQAGEAETGEAEVGDSDSEKIEMENREQKHIKVDTTELTEQGLHLLKCVSNKNLIFQIFCLDESPNVESTTNYAPDNSDDNSNDGKFSAKMVQNPEDTYQREIDILQKLFPQKDKVHE